MIDNNDTILMGVIGSAVGATGASLSVTELQAYISIGVTVLGFLISVIIPTIVKISRKIKEAKKDGKVTKEEINDIKGDIADLVDAVKIMAEKKEPGMIFITAKPEEEEESDDRDPGQAI